MQVPDCGLVLTNAQRRLKPCRGPASREINAC